MAVFVNDSALSLAPWSGFKPCTAITDCYLNERSEQDVLIACQFLMQAPVQNQKYCICDLSLGGELCSIVTEAAVYQIICYSSYIIVTLWPLLLGLWEIKERMKLKQNINAVYVSLLIATASCICGISYGVISIWVIVVGIGTPGIVYVRVFCIVLLLPLGFTTAFCSAMIISLDLLKIVHDPALGGNWNRAREQRVRFFVMLTCISIVLAYAIVVVLVSAETSSLVIFVFVVGGAVFSLSSGRQFNRSARSIVTKAESNRTDNNVVIKFKAATTANRQASLGLSGMVIINILIAVTLNFTGSVVKEDGFESMAGLSAIGVLFLCITSHASINFGRKIRLIPQKRLKKTEVVMSSGLVSSFATPSRVAPM